MIKTTQVLKQKFTSGIGWNTLEALFFYISLIIHQFILFRITGAKFYGVVGILFALSYFLEAILDSGFLSSTAPLFVWLKASKTNCKKWICFILVPQILLYFLIPAGIFLLQEAIFSRWAHTTIVQIFIQHKHLLLLFATTLASDGIRKTLNGVMQIAFLNRMSALIEMACVITYMVLVWGQYFLNGSFTIYSVFGPLLFSTSLGVFLMIFGLRSWYKKLPEKSSISTKLPVKQIFKNRMFNFAHELSTQLFSNSFLVPFFALHIGIEQAGIFQLISSIEHYLRSIIKRIFALTSNALLSHAKTMSLACKQKMFTLATGKLYPVLYGIFFFMMINITRLIPMGQTPIEFVSWPLIYFFFFIMFLHNFFVVYERFYVVEERVQYLFYSNIVVLLILGLFIYFSFSIPTAITYSALAILRITYYAIMMFTAYRIWNIKAQWKVKKIALAIMILFSLLAFVSI